MQLSKVEGTAIAIEEDEKGKLYYVGHIFLDDHRVIPLDPVSTPEIAQEQIERFVKFIQKVEVD